MITRSFLVPALLCFTACAACGADAKIPLPIEYPKAAFYGTPKPIPPQNLEPLQETAPRFIVGAGVKLLSRGCRVTASDDLPMLGELSYITDGDKTGIDGTVVELAPRLQWVQIDLGTPAKIAAVAVWHFHGEKRVYHAVIVQLSNDPAFRDGVFTLYNNDANNSAGRGRGSERAYIETNFGRIIDGKATGARYVRLYSNGNTSDELNHYCEVEVFGER